MTKISKKLAYGNKNPISDNDYVVGTNGDTEKLETKSFQLSDFRNYLIAGLTPETGGTLKITEIVYSGVLTTPEAVANQLNPAQIIQRYEVLVLNVNGDKYLLKLQDVVIGILQDAVLSTDFIAVNLVGENLSEDISTYKGYNSTTGREEHYSIGSVGFSITKELDGLNETGKILLEQTEQTNLGTGLPIYKGFNNTTKKQEFYNVKSNNLTVELVGGDLVINTPSTASIPALYVNDLYIPTYNDWLVENKLQNGGTAVGGFIFRGKGTIAQPFTNNIVYPLLGGSPTTTPNTAIQNALDGDSGVGYTTKYSYQGTGTRLNPQRSGQQIIVQNNNSIYTFAGNLGYSNLNLKLEGTVVSTTTGYILDADNVLHFNNADSATITLDADAILQIQGLGFNNSGSTIATNNFTDDKKINLLGTGRIEALLNVAPLTRYVINSDIAETGNNNDGGLTFDVRCFIKADYQGIYNVKGKSRIYFTGASLQSGNIANTVDVNLKAFNQEGGFVRFTGESTISISGGNRTNGVTFTPNVLYTTTYSNNGGVYQGACINLFNKLNAEDVDFTVVDSNSGTSLTITNVFESPDLWRVLFKNNNLATGNIDITKVDLTQGNNVSTINFIGNNVIENLVVYASKADAKTAGLVANSAFVKRNVFNAGSFIVGVEYKIVTVGTTNFTLIGASANTIGLFFIATGVGLGTGTASLETREILT